jgi:phage-related baseplate assembly protein
MKIRRNKMGVFTETDAATLYDAFITKLQTDTGEQMYPGDERRIFTESLVGMLVIVFNTIDDVAKQSLLKYARGDVLDALGYGIADRLEAGHATTTLKFELDTASDYDISIPQGTRAETGNGLKFETVEAAIIPQGSLYVEVGAQAVEGGEKYNGYLAGAVDTMTDIITFVTAVSNTTETSGGYDGESDDDYRERIQLAYTKFSTAGPRNAYKYWALSADSSIADAYIANPSANNIVVSVITNDGQLPDNALNALVEQSVTADDVRPLGDLVTVTAPTASNYDIEVTYYVKAENESEAVAAIESEEYTDASGTTIKGAFEQYRLWQDTKIERDINPSKLIELMMNPAGDGSIAGAERVELISPTYTQLTGAVVAHLGTITATHVVMSEE